MPGHTISVGFVTPNSDSEMFDDKENMVLNYNSSDTTKESSFSRDEIENSENHSPQSSPASVNKKAVKVKVNVKNCSSDKLLFQLLMKCDKINGAILKLDNKLSKITDDFGKFKTIEVRSKNPVSVRYFKIKVIQNGEVIHGEEHFQRCKKLARLIKENGLYRCNCEKCQNSNKPFEGKLNDVHYHIRKSQRIFLKCTYCPKSCTHLLSKLRKHIRDCHLDEGEEGIRESEDD